MKRDYLYCYINGVPTEIHGDDIFLPLSEYLRTKLLLVGTKEVCREGDCGACSVLVSRSLHKLNKKCDSFRAVNACIFPMFLADASSIVTVESLSSNLNEVQNALIEYGGTQCGFCTPGFAVTLSAYFEGVSKKKCSKQNIKNILTGNLCRCTGYEGIVNAGLSIKGNDTGILSKKYFSKEIQRNLIEIRKRGICIKGSKGSFDAPIHLNDACEIKMKTNARIFGGGTDIGVMLNKGKTIINAEMVLDHIDELYEMKEENGGLLIGSRVLIEDFRQFIKDKVEDIGNLLNIFASPQIKNVATVVGNIANGSPIGDMLPLFYALDAEIILISTRGKRKVSLRSFIKGYKSFDYNPGEFISYLFFRLPHESELVKCYKISKRRDLDISSVTFGSILKLSKMNIVEEISLFMGGVGPNIIELVQAERYILGKNLSSVDLEEVKKKVLNEISPQTDVRGKKSFRFLLAKNIIQKWYQEIVYE
ncbi:FAD binding domain-containing protein [Bacteriovoracaceae bacterium]|nr:FAD binding domain-containing protein [Bacteriovoracaceae bacterium]